VTRLKKVKNPLVTIIANTDYDSMVRCSSPFPWSWAGTGFALHHTTSTTCRYLPGFYTSTPSFTDRGTRVWTTCPRLLRDCSAAAGLETIRSLPNAVYSAGLPSQSHIMVAILFLAECWRHSSSHLTSHWSQPRRTASYSDCSGSDQSPSIRCKRN